MARLSPRTAAMTARAYPSTWCRRRAGGAPLVAKMLRIRWGSVDPWCAHSVRRRNERFSDDPTRVAGPGRRRTSVSVPGPVVEDAAGRVDHHRRDLLLAQSPLTHGGQ